MINKLAQKYLDMHKGRKLYPPLNGYSPFIQGSEYTKRRYVKEWFPEKYELHQCVLIREGRAQVRLPEDIYKYVSAYTLNEFLTDRKQFEKKTEYFARNVDKIDKIYPSLTYQVLAKKSWPELYELVNDIRDTIWSSNAAAGFTIYLDKEMCKGVISPQTLDEIWPHATEAAFKSFDKAQLMDVLGKIVESGGSKDKWPAIVEYCQYFFTDYYSAKNLKVTEEMLRERYAKYIGDATASATTIDNEKKHLAEIENEHANWLEELKGGKHDLKEHDLAEYLQIVMKVRDSRKNFFNKGLTVIYRIAERMFNECGVDLSLIPYYTMMELLKGPEYLLSKKNELIKRKAGFTLLIPYDAPYEMELAPVDEGMDAIDEFFKAGHLEGSGRELRGQTGCKGKVKGVIRVVKNNTTFKDFVEGEILVAGMTRPEYVPLMEKAAAIITDEGGITCHAAIVSRELGKPCIIGTKIATQVLKTGDLVEMDAGEGIVRIL